jgi:hypothetical protein
MRARGNRHWWTGQARPVRHLPASYRRPLMDPDAALEDLLNPADFVTSLAAHEVGEWTGERDILRIAELPLALDGWLTAGGFMPTRWQSASRRSA